MVPTIQIRIFDAQGRSDIAYALLDTGASQTICQLNKLKKAQPELLGCDPVHLSGIGTTHPLLAETMINLRFSPVNNPEIIHSIPALGITHPGSWFASCPKDKPKWIVDMEDKLADPRYASPNPTLPLTVILDSAFSTAILNKNSPEITD